MTFKLIKTNLLAVISLLIATTSISTYADVKDAMTSATNSVVKFGKDVVEGVGDGIDKGLGRDKAAKDAFANYLVQVLSYSTKDGFTTVTVGVKEKDGKSNTIKDINKKTIFLVDAQGYATELNREKTTIDSVSLPEKAGRKFDLIFNQVNSPATLRLFGIELPIEQK